MMNVELRSVEKKDWEFILHLRNQEEVRLASHDTSIIDDETHLKYMQEMTVDKKKIHWIIIYNKKQKPNVGIKNMLSTIIEYLINHVDYYCQ